MIDILVDILIGIVAWVFMISLLIGMISYIIVLIVIAFDTRPTGPLPWWVWWRP